ncbi:MAG TPA: hypothetical protein VNO26_16450 [Candidatus Limnocylindria bacterium]|nr:hypothetical protein [Candidatus Limnocylindria bacterium]
MGLWESVGICLGFSFLLIAVDEVIHARRRRRREQGGQSGH